MADEFQLGTGNWWDSTRSSTTRFDSRGPTPTGSSTLSSMGRSYESASAGVGAGAGAGLLADPNLHLMGLGLSSQNMDWNQSLLRGGKSGSSFGTMLQEESTTTNYQQQDEQWRQKLFDGNSDDSSNNCYKQIESGGLSLDQQQYSSSNSSITCQGLNNNFQVDSTSYNNSNTNVLQGFLVSENQQQTNFDSSRSLNYGYPPAPPNYALQTPINQLTPQSWSKFPQLLRASPPKQPPPPPPPHGQLHFSNNTPYWNASSTTVNDGQPSFFSPLQLPVPPSSFLERSKNTTSEIQESAGTIKKNSNEPLIKRARQETTPPPAMPAFKVRKEKMGDRITALQQLVSPFGKTDTASVLSEAIEYIKFLHDQVSVLSTPYLKSAAPINPQLNSGNLQNQEVSKQDLKSRGLCLVPVSSTFPVTHETTVDFWTPTFGGTFR